MKTEFKIFESEWGYLTMEDIIKDYQKEHHLEIKDVLLIKSNEGNPIVGVLFEKRSEDENK